MLCTETQPTYNLNLHASPKLVLFKIHSNFQVEKILGEGAYGVVCSATHKPTGMKVAIKKIEPFEKPLIGLRTLREIRLLNKFKNHENIITLYEVHRPASFNNFKEVYLIQEYMPTDLSRVIQSHNLSDEHCQYFVYQILRGLKLIHSANVIHRDLKPSNILVNDHCDLKICDFGLARLDTARTKYENELSPAISLLTEYVATRWYRAPEIMLSASQYSTAVDLWGVGCIMAELFAYTPLFPGSDFKNQLDLILAVVGTPVGTDLQSIKSLRSRQYVESLPFKKKLDFGSLLNNHPLRVKRVGNTKINPQGIDLLEKLLIFDPKRRITVEEALSHPYLKSYHDPNDEPVTTPMRVEDFDFDVAKGKLNNLELKTKIYNEILAAKK